MHKTKVKKLMKKFLFILVLIFSASIAFAQSSKTSFEVDNKYQLLLQKGQRAEKNGEYDEAIVSYEEAYEHSNNVQPLLTIASLYIIRNMPDMAEKTINRIPLEKLPDKGKAEVLYIKGNIHLTKNEFEVAGDAFSKTIKLNSDKVSAKVKLAMINLMRGFPSRAEELLNNEDSFSGYAFEDLRLCLAIDMYNANFGRAYNTCELIGKQNIDTNPGAGFLELLTNQAFFMFVCFLPLLLSGLLSVIYYIFLFIALGFTASALGKKTSFWHIFVFVVVGVTLLFISHLFCIDDVYKAFIIGNAYGYVYDGIWIMPKVIITSHLIALSLFLIFPCFKLLKENMRPASYELLGLWLFCFFFGLFVISFQTNTDVAHRFIYIMVGMFFSLLSALIMPFGKLMLYKLSQVAGFSLDGKIDSSSISEGNLSLTDVKILETKMWNFISKGEIDSALALGKKVLTPDYQKTFPSFWQAMIFAQICNEEYETAAKNINDYYQIYQGTSHYEIGQVWEAWLKTEKGDFPIAYKLVNSISADRAKSMNADEVAISLLVLARCCLNVKDNVQAHINFNKALNCSKSLLIKLIVLTDIAELDSKMNAKQAMQKWKTMVETLKGNGKCIPYQNTVNSMVAFSEGNKDLAFKLASECLKDKSHTGKAVAWYGHLLCLEGKSNDAEELLSRMTAGSYTADCLMTEVTSGSTN
jgi:tetratricopeptide (TPR) repeat protein